jgi:hypothetical protein
MHNKEVVSVHTDTPAPETTQRIVIKLGTGGSFQKVVHPRIHLNYIFQKVKARLIIFLTNGYHITSVHLFRVHFNVIIRPMVRSLLRIQFKQAWKEAVVADFSRHLPAGCENMINFSHDSWRPSR